MENKYKKIKLRNGLTMDEHRIVMEKYLKRELDTFEHVHHCNGNPRDNRIENLELMTIGDHTRLHMLNGDLHKISDPKLNPNDVKKIRRLLKTGELTHLQISKMFNVSRWSITDINLKRSWKHI